MKIIRINNEIFSLENIIKINLHRLCTDSYKIYFYYNNNTSADTVVLTEDLAEKTFNKIEKILQIP